MSSPDSMIWHACMFHISLDEFDFIEDTLLEYDIGGYLIGHESEPHSHYHMLFQSNNKVYNTFSKRLVEKYGLRGQAKKGKARQYGKIKLIKDLEKLKSYTIKDGNFRSNLQPGELESYFEQSFKKKDLRKHMDRCSEYLDSLDLHKSLIRWSQDPSFDDVTTRSYTPHFTLLKKEIINYNLKNDLRISRITINNQVLHWLKTSVNFQSDAQKIDLIHSFIF